MAHVNRGRFPSRSQSLRRKTSWSAGPASTGPGGLQTITASGKTAWGVTSISLEDGLTLVRTLGELNTFLTSADVVTSGFHGAVGICKVTEQAAAIGVIAIPGPITDILWDGWLYHRVFSLIAADPALTTGGVTAPLQMGAGSASLRLEIDSKAMRKFDALDVQVGIIEVTEIGVASMRFFANTRVLDKLS